MSPDSFKHIRLSPDPVESFLDLIHFKGVISRPGVGSNNCQPEQQDWDDDHQENLIAGAPGADWLVLVDWLRLLWHLRKDDMLLVVRHFDFFFGS